MAEGQFAAPSAGPADPIAADAEWLELFDPHTNRVVYANIVSGQCSWTRPDRSIVARDPNGEWWELVDEDTGAPYYYNSTTGATEWEAPEQATVVPFHALLTSSVGRRLSLVVTNRGSMAFSSEQADSLARKASRVSLRSTEGRLSRKTSRAASESRHRRKISTGSAIVASPDSPTDSAVAVADARKRLEGGAGRRESGVQPAEGVAARRHRLSAQRNSQSETALETLKEALAASCGAGLDERDELAHGGDGGGGGPAAAAAADGDYSVPASANVEHFRSSAQTARMSAAGYGAHGERASTATSTTVMMHAPRNRSMPSMRGGDGGQGMRAFASTQFAAQKRGFLRRKVPLDEMISYASDAPARPLLNLPRELARDAVRSFRVVQRFMGNDAAPSRFDDVLWLANAGVRAAALRDEVFCQLAKQVTGNPSAAAAEKGWTLLGVLLYAFRPSAVLLPHLDAFVGAAAVPTLALRRFLRLQLARARRSAGRGAELSAKELRLALTVPSRPLVFGSTLGAMADDDGGRGELANRRTGLPRVLEQLAQLIVRLGGERTEGLFRVPANGDAVFAARLHIEAGHPDFSGVSDPHVPASLLKEWLRDLAEPLIPDALYDECMAAPDDPDVAAAVVARLAEPARRVLGFLLRFFAALLQPHVVARTKMDAANLALVFGPTLLRNPVSDLRDVFANSAGEQAFVLTLINSGVR
ncbi:hypothetical protein LPJ53_005431 [Coemansia erecta]|uniref:RhoGAP-domain-containing protein n=1 Tax=Coemansia erecta TaxID=147472 RepID=A0A9W8CNU0_9FUNG|nr:hypothetical protein LPJ53_005431 [Coemansia erecta]